MAVLEIRARTYRSSSPGWIITTLDVDDEHRIDWWQSPISGRAQRSVIGPEDR